MDPMDCFLWQEFFDPKWNTSAGIAAPYSVPTAWRGARKMSVLCTSAPDAVSRGLLRSDGWGRILITGGCDFADRVMLFGALDRLHDEQAVPPSRSRL